jgi:hypothetical protein
VIELLDTLESKYLDILDKAENILFFHHPCYLKLLAEHLNATSYILFVEDGERNSVTIPFLLKEGSKGKVVNSLPYFGSNGSFISSGDFNTVNLLKINAISELESWCLNHKVVSINIVTNYFNQNEKKWFEDYFKPDFISERFGQVTNLPHYAENYDSILIKQFQDPRPRNIRKAINSGVIIRKANSDMDWDFLYEVHKENMEGIGAPVKKRAFFTLVKHELTQEFYTLYIAEIESNPIACMLVFHSFQTVEYYTPGTLSEYRNQQPSALLVFEAMKEFAQKGYKFWNWGGSSSRDSGVYDFKKKWGAEEMPYYHMTKIINSTIYNSTAQELMEEYPGFFVVPFNQLKNAEN